MSQFPPSPLPPGPPPTLPYDSPVLQNYPNRPVSVTVLSIIVLVLYGGTLLCSPFSLLALFAPKQTLAQQPNNPVLNLMHDNGLYRVWLLVSVVIGLAIAAAYVIGAIQSLRGKALGRKLMVAMSIATLVMGLVNLGVTIFILMPELLHAYRTATDPAIRFGTMFGLVGGLVGPFIGAILPGCILYFFQTPNVVDYFGPRQTQSWNSI